MNKFLICLLKGVNNIDLRVNNKTKYLGYSFAFIIKCCREFLGAPLFMSLIASIFMTDYDLGFYE